jgi:hypothetical protein
VLACLVLVTGSVRAEQRLYSLEIPDAQATTFEVPFEVEHAGEVSIRADWSGNRPLAFRIDPPGGKGTTVRRSGTSPIHLELDVDSNQLGQGPWTLIIHALPLSGAGQGRLTIDLPEQRSAQPKDLPPAGLFPAKPKRPIEEWQKPQTFHGELSREQRRVVQSTESFRKLLVDSKKRAPDTCRWQDDLLQWLATQRDHAINQSVEADPATGKLMTQMVAAIRSVDEIRRSRDPLLVGPAPAERHKRVSWERLRTEQLRPVERGLDELMTAVQRDHAPELHGEQWPLRLVSCLTATERYFDQRWLAGADNAPNRDLAEAQWSPLNRAATALAALADLAPDDAIRLPSRNP